MPQQEQLHGGYHMTYSAVELHRRAYPELAAALRGKIDTILNRWRDLTMKELPLFDRFTIEQFEDDLRTILESAAHALGSSSHEELRPLLEKAPRHGFDRFLHDADLLDLLMEERILRGVIVITLEEHLDRRLEPDEAASLHAIIDVMIQQGVLAMVQKQKEKLREAAEAEIKFLSYFSHDISNNLMVISASLDVLKTQLEASQQFDEARDLLDTARRTIRHTTDGMRRLLSHERLRRTEQSSVTAEINLHEKFSKIANFFSEEAKAKGMQMTIDVDPDATIKTDPDLLYIILQNIVGNAVKHSNGNEVRLEAQWEETDGREQWRISVADQGPGIKRDQLESIFEAFKQGEALGAEGVGLGLAIAAQAAKLLDAQIDVDTQLGEGTTFHIYLPATSTQSKQPNHAAAR